MFCNNFLTSDKIPFSSKLMGNGNGMVGKNPGCNDNFHWNKLDDKIEKADLLVFLGKCRGYHNEIWLSLVKSWLKL